MKDFYNLDAIIAICYRVNSKRATQFRIWATKILKEYIVKGFAMDDDRLKAATRLIESRGNPELPTVGLTSWRGSIVRKQDIH